MNDKYMISWINKDNPNIQHFMEARGYGAELLQNLLKREGYKFSVTKSETEDSIITEIRKALVKYIKSEGCACCQNVEEHDKARNRLGQLLSMPKYSDDSGYDFYTESEE